MQDQPEQLRNPLPEYLFRPFRAFYQSQYGVVSDQTQLHSQLHWWWWWWVRQQFNFRVTSLSPNNVKPCIVRLYFYSAKSAKTLFFLFSEI